MPTFDYLGDIIFFDATEMSVIFVSLIFRNFTKAGGFLHSMEKQMKDQNFIAKRNTVVIFIQL